MWDSAGSSGSKPPCQPPALFARATSCGCRLHSRTAGFSRGLMAWLPSADLRTKELRLKKSAARWPEHRRQGGSVLPSASLLCPLHFWSARQGMSHENARFLNVPTAPTGTKRGNGDGCSKSELCPFEEKPPTRGRVWVFLPTVGPLGGCRGRKELCRQSLAVFRPRPPVRVHPPHAGVEAGHPGLRGCLSNLSGRRGNRNHG